MRTTLLSNLRPLWTPWWLQMWRYHNRRRFQSCTWSRKEQNRRNSVKVFQEFSEKLDLVDAWRALHPNISRFRRLDFFLVNQSVANITTLSNIYPGYKSDHSMITLKLSLHSNLRGPVLWKLNTSFVIEINYVNQIKATIQETRDEYREDDFVTSLGND